MNRIAPRPAPAQSLRPNRRQFLSAAVGASVAARAWAAEPSRGAPASRISVGVIGTGMIGRRHIEKLLTYTDVQITAVCDVSQIRRDDQQAKVNAAYAATQKAGTYKGCGGYVDFRELLDRRDIDAVVVATPDHWHAVQAVLACRAKKDVYCEKPLSHSIAEGRAMVRAAEANGTVFQVGSQQRSEWNGLFVKAVELVRNGRLGKIERIDIGVGGPPKPCDLPDEPTPAGLDWDWWLGPAPRRAFNAILCPKDIHNYWVQWRAFREYGGGALADVGAHHFDIAQWALDMDRSGPTEITPPADPAATTGLTFRYANGVVMHHGGPDGVTFHGERGTLHVTREEIESAPASLATEPLGEGAIRVGMGNEHKRIWLDCIKSRKQPVAPVEAGHRTATVCHLANLAYRLHRKLQWDPAAERFVGDEEANGFLDYRRREPWDMKL